MTEQTKKASQLVNDAAEGARRATGSPSRLASEQDLRAQAEAALASRGTQPETGVPELGPGRMAHELNVHRIELEMQNEELKRSQAELETARNYLLGLFDNSPIATLTLDAAFQVREANAAAEALLGFPQGLAGTSLQVFIAARYRPLFSQTLHRALRLEERGSCELQYAPFKSETVRWLRLHCAALAPQETPEGAVLLCSLEDITPAKNFELNLVLAKNAVESEVQRRTQELQQTVEQLHAEVEERRRAEQAWMHSEQRYRSLVDQLPAVVYTATCCGARRFLFLSPQVCDMLGYDPEELTADPDRWLRCVHPEDRELVQLELERSAAPDATLDLEYRFLCKDGRCVWLRDQAKTVSPEPPHGEAFLPPPGAREPEHQVYLQGLLFDISATKELNEELIAARQRAEAANQAKSEFLANMSHEVRTPLNGVLGMLQLLQLGYLEEEQRTYINLATESGRSLLRVINDILDFSKIEAGKLELAVAPFELQRLLRGVLHTFRDQVLSKGLALHVKVGDTVPERLSGDEARLRQILFNLVGNAVKFTEQGEVAVEVRRMDMGNSLRLEIEIRDTGVGIPLEEQQRIFEPFTQIDGTATRRHQGTGLGLGIVKRLTELMGGTISLHSEPGTGTSFVLELPFEAEEESPSPAFFQAQTRAAAEGPRPLRILLAEDNAVNMLAASRMLEAMGHKVHRVENGLQVLEALQGLRFDCVLLDVQMPELDGLEVTRAIRAGEVPKVPRDYYLIAMTAHAMRGDRERFLAAGMDDYVAKPLDMHDLAEVLERVAGRLEP